MSAIHLLDTPLHREHLQAIANEHFGDMVKGAVDLEKGLLAIGAELHADIEAFFLDLGSELKNLWGINLYPALDFPDLVEFNSMINIRPSQGNTSRNVEDVGTQQKILAVVKKWIHL